MDDPNITMEDYIRLEEEKALRRGTVYNWETAKYGKIWYDEDVHDLRSVETELYSSSLLIEAFTSEEPSERNDNVGGVFINLEISKCWSLEIPRWLFNTLFAHELNLENHS
ncbi:hypothetical protein Tco_1337895 [Tanacetum coccineum]